VGATNYQVRIPDFPRARQGYQRTAVDSYLRDLRRRLDTLSRTSEDQAGHITALTSALSELEARYDRLQTATPEGRAQDVLAAARDQAAVLVADAERAAARRVADAERQAEVVEERSRQEHAWRRRQLARERDELAQQKLAMRSQLRSFRALAVSSTQLLPDQDRPLAERHS